MRSIDWSAFWTGVLGAVSLLMVLGVLSVMYNDLYDRAYNQGFERGAYVERICPQDRTFHCPLGDK